MQPFSAILLATAVAVLTPIALIAQEVTYHDLPIYSEGVKSSKLDLYIEDSVLVPSLLRDRLTGETVKAIAPYRGSPEAQSIVAELVSRNQLTLGHAMPYFYVALNHAVARIYRNVSLNPEPNASKQGKALGFDVDPRSPGFMNLRDLVAVKPIQSQRIRVEVYFTRSRFDQATARLRLHSAEAFFDPASRRLGIFVDRSLFRWLPYQAAWGSRTSAQTAQHVRDYVIRLTLKQAAHELFHLVQSASGNIAYGRPFLAEASAVLVQENLTFREEMFQITGAQLARGLPLLPPEGSACNALRSIEAPFGMEAMYRLARADTSVRRKQISIARWLTSDDPSFYSQDDRSIALAYDIGPAFILFASSRSRTDFRKRFGPLVSGGSTAEVKSALGTVDAEFARWYRDFAREFWSGDGSEEAYGLATKVVDICLGQRQYPVAFVGSRTMGALEPTRVKPLVYAGDVFFRLGVPFFALDYYAAAAARARTHGYADDSEVRVLSRLGDAYEELGDLGSAIRMFTRAEGVPLSSLDLEMFLVALRSRLKKSFYEPYVRAGGKQNSDALMLVNAYVEILQFGGCPDSSEAARLRSLQSDMQRGDAAALRKDLQSHFDALSRRIATVATAPDYGAALNERMSYCGPQR